MLRTAMPDGRYASIAEVQADLDPAVDEDKVSRSILLAEAIVDATAGHSFGETAVDLLVEDVRGDLVPIPPPFSHVTAVLVDGYALPPSTYRVSPAGIRLLGYDSFGLGRGV